MPEKRTKQQKAAMLEALEQSLGVVTTAAKKCGIQRFNHYNWYKNDPEYREAVDDMNNVALDFSESQLFKQIQKGVPASTIFYLKTKGKERGYIERQEIEHSGEVINITIEKTYEGKAK